MNFMFLLACVKYHDITVDGVDLALECRRNSVSVSTKSTDCTPSAMVITMDMKDAGHKHVDLKVNKDCLWHGKQSWKDMKCKNISSFGVYREYLEEK